MGRDIEKEKKIGEMKGQMRLRVKRVLWFKLDWV